jgi:hypothetical protein
MNENDFVPLVKIIDTKSKLIFIDNKGNRTV